MHHDLLSHLVVYPSTSFPGRTQEGLLVQLLRKKLLPEVEDWVAAGRMTDIDDDEIQSLNELWEFAKDWSGQRIAIYAMEEQAAEYTADEKESGIEGVNTGLRDDDEDESDEDDEDNEDKPMTGISGNTGGKPPNTSNDGKSMNEILRFMTTGAGLG